MLRIPLVRIGTIRAIGNSWVFCVNSSDFGLRAPPKKMASLVSVTIKARRICLSFISETPQKSGVYL